MKFNERMIGLRLNAKTTECAQIRKFCCFLPSVSVYRDKSWELAYYARISTQMWEWAPQL